MSTVQVTKELIALQNRFISRAHNCYIEGLNCLRQDAALGEDIKLEKGLFGKKELDSHRLAARYFGYHLAYTEAAKDVHEVLTKLAKE